MAGLLFWWDGGVVCGVRSAKGSRKDWISAERDPWAGCGLATQFGAKWFRTASDTLLYIITLVRVVCVNHQM